MHLDISVGPAEYHWHVEAAAEVLRTHASLLGELRPEHAIPLAAAIVRAIAHSGGEDK